MIVFRPNFVPAPRVYGLLERIGQVRERVRSSLIKVPWVPSLVKDAMARLAWGSTAIEGCTLSLEAVKGLLEGRKILDYPDRHVRMAANYLEALSWIQKQPSRRPISENAIFHLHRIVAEGATEDGPIGDYRRVDVRAGLHVGAPWKRVPRLTRELLAWLGTKGAELPAVFSSAILHLRFVEIHPFRDGNGRLARALATWELYRRGFDTLHVFALDEVLLENRALYIRALQRVQVEGENLGGWIEFMAEALLETLERVEKRVQSIGATPGEPISLTYRQEKLLRVLRERGTLGIRDLARALRLTAPGAHYALKPLLARKIVIRKGAHKTSRYSLP
jgi:Fic family protein